MKSKTTILKGSNPVRSWILVDLSGKTLGRVATEIAAILMGKNNLITLGFNNKKYIFALVFRDCINLISPVKIIKYWCCR